MIDANMMPRMFIITGTGAEEFAVLVRLSTNTVTYSKWMGRTPRGWTGGAAAPRRGSAESRDEQERDGAP